MKLFALPHKKNTHKKTKEKKFQKTKGAKL